MYIGNSPKYGILKNRYRAHVQEYLYIYEYTHIEFRTCLSSMLTPRRRPTRMPTTGALPGARYTYVHVGVHIYIYVCTCVCLYIYIYICVCVCILSILAPNEDADNGRVYVYMYIYICIYIYVYMYM